MNKTVLFAVCMLSANLFGAYLIEPAAELELVQDVDVVVVGGSSGAVAAALKAEEAGASVFLIGQRPFLGDDMASTYRLRLSEGEDTGCPLLKSIFSRDEPVGADVPFTYEYNRSPAAAHDDKTGSMLCDGRWISVSGDSVQFDSDVEITLDVKADQLIDDFSLIAYSRRGKEGFDTASVEISGDNGSGKWRKIASVKEPVMTGYPQRVEFKAPIKGRYRKLKIKAAKSDGVSRQLLGEIYLFSGDYKKAEAYTAVQTTTPFKIKNSLDKALLDAGIDFMTGCSSSEILVDDRGVPSGVIIADRNGRQCVKAKVIIDATERGVVARAAGAEASPFPAGEYIHSGVLWLPEKPRRPRGCGLKSSSAFLILM
ncbi:MAG: FAD-dependent oxidoreductase [Kiritimatiellia bacterium]